eukprot:9077611-Alexandrium_andersonii.AAC.1
MLEEVNGEAPIADVVVFQEHSLGECKHAPLVKAASFRDCKLVLGPCEPGRLKPTAGVGMLARRRTAPVKHKVIVKELRDFQNRGRVAVYMVDVGGPMPMYLINIYGWPDASVRAEARRETNHMMSLVFQE